MNPQGAPAARRARAVESFQNAAECIGPVEAGMAVFAVTRGQFSMIDAILHVLDQVGRAKLSLWTWTIADYEVQVFERLMLDDRVTEALLVIDHAARSKNRPLLEKWVATFGPSSIRLVVNHSKIATVEASPEVRPAIPGEPGAARVLLRGSMNLNFNPRFEQLDVTEGGADFDLVKRIEGELEVLDLSAGGDAVYRSSKVSNAFEPASLALFRGIKTWAK